MRVYNEKVDRCCECPILDHLDMDGSPFCGMLNEEVDNNKIHPDCPFSKPITKEVIEGFGFKVPNFVDQYFKNKEWERDIEGSDDSFGNPKTYSLRIDQYGKIEIRGPFGDFRLFYGKLNNPEELEFILRRVGAIE